MTVSYENDWEYASAKLGGSIVRYEGYPVWVIDVNDEGVSIDKIPSSGKSLRTQLCDLDLTPITLGFINGNSTCSYVQRVPKRNDWKQGVRAANLIGLSGSSSQLNINSVDFVNTVLNKYPSIENCMEYIECGECDSRAFNRRFSLGLLLKEGFSLFYKEYKIGYLDPVRAKSYILDKQYFYLKELLEESLSDVQSYHC